MVRSVLRDPVKLNPGFGVRWVVFGRCGRCPFSGRGRGKYGFGNSGDGGDVVNKQMQLL